jgi:hypothetical protein
VKDATHIAVLLDRSGSMGDIKDDAIGGFNCFLKEQKAAGANAHPDPRSVRHRKHRRGS